MSDSDAKRYRAYLLRMWRGNDDEPWRASLEDPHGGERRHFASVEQLALFLEGRAGRELSENQANPETDP